MNISWFQGEKVLLSQSNRFLTFIRSKLKSYRLHNDRHEKALNRSIYYIPWISSIFNTGVSVSSLIVISGGMITKSPCSGGELPPQVKEEDHISIYSKSADS